MRPSSDLPRFAPVTTSCVGAVALVCAVAVMLAGAAAPSGAAAAVPRGIYWGAQIGDQITGEAAPWDMRPVRRLQKVAGKSLSLIEFASPFVECEATVCTPTSFPSTPLENIRAYGAIPVFSWNSGSSPPSLEQPAFSLPEILSGRYDAYIREFAEKAKAWGHPFFLRFDWEMNGNWFPWSEGVDGNAPGEYVEAWRHVHDIFTSVGATNATWVWCPNVDIGGGLAPLRPLYPGNSYVDWTCLDGFNWGPRKGSPGWLTFDEIFRSTYRQVTKIAPRKPMMLAEFASTDRGGSKPKWIEDTFKRIRTNYPKIRGAVWFDVDDRGTGWPIENSKSAGAAFRRAIANPAYRPAEFGALSSGPIAPPSN
jgi:hypothetical protein